MNELLQMWKEYRSLPLIEEHSRHCLMRVGLNNCNCDRQKRIDYSVNLWNKIKNKLDELSDESSNTRL